MSKHKKITIEHFVKRGVPLLPDIRIYLYSGRQIYFLSTE